MRVLWAKGTTRNGTDPENGGERESTECRAAERTRKNRAGYDGYASPSSPERSGYLPLGELVPGQSGIVAGTKTRDGAARLRLRLLDMGFVPGTRVEFLGSAPGGDPVLVRLRGYDLALRRGDASLVMVKVKALREG